MHIILVGICDNNKEALLLYCISYWESEIIS